MKKALDILIGVVFFLFALVQLNDSDVLMWVLPYLFISYLALNSYRERYLLIASSVLLLFFMIWMLRYIPHMRDWISDGMPSIAESMETDSPYIEQSREFFGLLLCALASLYYMIKAKQNR